MSPPGGDEIAALHRLRAAWGRDWAAAREALVTLLVAGGRLAAAGAILADGDENQDAEGGHGP